MPTPLEIIETEMDNQVGLYDAKVNHAGTGAVYNTSRKGCKESYFCGFSKVHKLTREQADKLSRDGNNTVGKNAKDDWMLSADDIINELAIYEYCFEVAYINYNGFSLEEA